MSAKIKQNRFLQLKKISDTKRSEIVKQVNELWRKHIDEADIGEALVECCKKCRTCFAFAQSGCGVCTKSLNAIKRYLKGESQGG
jgi:hypothetical protein